MTELEQQKFLLRFLSLKKCRRKIELINDIKKRDVIPFLVN